MKINSLFVILLLVFGASQMQAQIGPGKPVEEIPGIKGCAELVNVQQVCQDDGKVEITFAIFNNSNFNATKIQISDGNGWSQVIHTFLPAQTVSFNPIVYTGADPLSKVCFTVTLSSSSNSCTKKICVDVIDCPCGAVQTNAISCDPSTPNEFVYCFEVINPAYSNFAVNQLIISSETPDICLDNNSLPTTMSIPSISPGNSKQVCVKLTGCNSPLQGSSDIDLQFRLLNSGILGFVCLLDPFNITTPCCEPGDCSDFTFKHVHWDEDVEDPNFHMLTIVSGIAATVTFQLTAFTSPDQLIVKVNGIEEINITPGTHQCNNMPSTLVESINIIPCDVVEITVKANVCGTYDMDWGLFVSCIDGSSLQSDSEEISYLKTLESFESAARRIQNNLEAFTIFPNPVSDVLNISTTDSEINYQSARILDNAGRTILTENRSGRTEWQLDVSRLPQGTYLLEVTDDYGNRMVEKFIKLK